MKNVFNINDITEDNIKKIANFFNNSDFDFGVKYDGKDILDELNRAEALISVDYNNKTMRLKTKDLNIIKQRNNPDAFFKSLLHEFRHTNQRMSSNPKIRNAALLANNNLKNGYKKFHDLVPYEIDANNFANNENLLQGIKNLISNDDTELLNKALKESEINNPLFTDEDVKTYIEKITTDSNYERKVIDESIIALKQMGYSNEEVKNMMNNINTYDDVDNLLKAYANSEVKLTNIVNNSYDYKKFIENHKSNNKTVRKQEVRDKNWTNEKEKLEQKIAVANKQWLDSRRVELDNEIKQATSRIDFNIANMDSLFSDFEKSIESVMHKSSNQKKVVQQQSIEPEVIQSLESKTSLKIGSSSYRFSPEQEFNGTMNFPRYKLDENGKLVNKRNIKQTTSEIVEQSTEEVGNQYLKRALSGRNLNALMNLGFAFSDYNEARNAGDGVLKAGVKAGAQFVAGEMLGGWMFPVMLAKQLPTLAVSAVETTQNITRKMNSTARIQTFGEAQFQDTQQLATMRQAGMELAKMSQYNLQQSIMGNEAQYMHRL